MQSGAQTFKFKIAWEIIESIRLPIITCENLAGEYYNPCDISLLMSYTIEAYCLWHCLKCKLKYYQILKNWSWSWLPRSNLCDLHYLTFRWPCKYSNRYMCNFCFPRWNSNPQWKTITKIQQTREWDNARQRLKLDLTKIIWQCVFFSEQMSFLSRCLLCIEVPARRTTYLQGLELWQIHSSTPE